MKFIVDRSKWRSGGASEDFNHEFVDKTLERCVEPVGKGSIRMENTKGFRCCLAFCAIQLDSKVLMINRTKPESCTWSSEEPNPLILRSDEGIIKNSPLSIKAMEINDDKDSTTTQREERLTRLFKEYGHEIEFINETVPYGPDTEEEGL